MMREDERPAARRPVTAACASALLAVLAVLALPAAASAQWATSGNNISNTNSGNVGVGTDAAPPAARLDVKGGTSDQSAAAVRVNNSADSSLFFVRNDGRVGFGTASPLGRLHTVSSGADNWFYADAFGAGVFPLLQARTARGTSAAPAAVTAGDIIYDIRSQGYTGATGYGNVGIIRFAVDGAVGPWVAPGRLTFHTGDSGGAVPERMRIDSSGNVGIGTAAPANALHVHSALGPQGIRVSGSGGGIINFQDSAVVNPDNQMYQWRSEGGKFRMALSNGVSGAFVRPNILVADFSGNVGIGTAAPAAALNVVGTGAGQSGDLRLDNGAVRTQLVSDATQGVGQVGTLTNHGLNIVTNNSMKMFITAEGDVGINKTLPAHKLDVAGDINAAAGLCIAGVCKASWSEVGSGRWESAAGGGPGIHYDAGNVGIGTASPAAALNVVGTGTGQSGAVRLDNGAVRTQLVSDATQGFAQFGTETNHGLNIITNNSMKVFITAEGVVGIGTAKPGGDPPSDPNLKLDVQGNVNVSGVINAKFQDVAEWVPSVQKLSAGTVVVLDRARTNHVLASSAAYDTKVAGVVSEQPGVILGTGGEGKLKVATTGRVKVRVDATRAPVEVGDLLVTGEVEGVAMKSVPVELGGVQIHRPGTIIGKALEPLEKGTGEILVLLSLQ